MPRFLATRQNDNLPRLTPPRKPLCNRACSAIHIFRASLLSLLDLFRPFPSRPNPSSVYNRFPSLPLLFSHVSRRWTSGLLARFLLSRVCWGERREGEEKICGPANSARRHDSLVYFRFTTGRSFLIYETTGRAGLAGSSHPLFPRRIKRSAKFLLDLRYSSWISSFASPFTRFGRRTRIRFFVLASTILLWMRKKE